MSRKHTIPGAYFSFVEHELYNYNAIKRMVEQERQDIIESTGCNEVPADGGGTSSSTENKAIKILSTASIIHAERTIRSIDKALALLSDEHMAVFKLKYCENMKFPEVCVMISCSERSFFRWRGELVETVAMFMGLHK